MSAKRSVLFYLTYLTYTTTRQINVTSINLSIFLLILFYNVESALSIYNIININLAVFCDVCSFSCMLWFRLINKNNCYTESCESFNLIRILINYITNKNINANKNSPVINADSL